MTNDTDICIHSKENWPRERVNVNQFTDNMDVEPYFVQVLRFQLKTYAAIVHGEFITGKLDRVAGSISNESNIAPLYFG